MKATNVQGLQTMYSVVRNMTKHNAVLVAGIEEVLTYMRAVSAQKQRSPSFLSLVPRINERAGICTAQCQKTYSLSVAVRASHSKRVVAVNVSTEDALHLLLMAYHEVALVRVVDVLGRHTLPVNLIREHLGVVAEALLTVKVMASQVACLDILTVELVLVWLHETRPPNADKGRQCSHCHLFNSIASILDGRSEHCVRLQSVPGRLLATVTLAKRRSRDDMAYRDLSEVRRYISSRICKGFCNSHEVVETMRLRHKLSQRVRMCTDRHKGVL
nr:hypothetical protein CFP56_11847 [Quercus suber]